ncbi:MAG TPA: hypothetical protein VMF29_00360, partial [Candidatus Edwardsbacteria bacterium]|nr:hypothetical protein [Candidatus Edwardsbacteria bacterium]
MTILVLFKTPSHMRRTAFITLMITLTVASVHAQKNVDWKGVRRAWDKYLSSPTPENADSVSVLLPTQQSMPPGKLVTHMDNTLVVLERQVSKAD